MSLVEKLRADYEMFRKVGREMLHIKFLARCALVLLVPAGFTLLLFLLNWQPASFAQSLLPH